MSIKSIFAASAVAIAAAAAMPVAHASATFQGLTFTFLQADSNTLTFEIQGTPSGDWTGVQFLGAFDIKFSGLDASTDPGTANGPGATNLLGLDSQLSASNLDCSKATGENGTSCFDINPDVALGATPIDFFYTIDFVNNITIDSTGVHLQIAFMNTEGGDKVGSLYSQDVALGSSSSSSSSSSGGNESSSSGIPEPGTSGLALLGLGLLGASLATRKARRG
jgi:hypothetical protein